MVKLPINIKEGKVSQLRNRVYEININRDIIGVSLLMKGVILPPLTMKHIYAESCVYSVDVDNNIEYIIKDVVGTDAVIIEITCNGHVSIKSNGVEIIIRQEKYGYTFAHVYYYGDFVESLIHKPGADCWVH